MGVRTPWCPRCGAWRGYVQSLCKGCVTINASITADMIAQKKQQMIAMLQAAMQPGDKTQEMIDTLNAKPEGYFQDLLVRELVQARFTKISEMRTDREAFTQSLEEMVEQNIDILKQVCRSWMRMRAESRRVRFNNALALEMVEVARASLEEVGALSLELSKYTENKARHEEIMQRVTFGMQTVENFIHPESNEPEEPVEADDLPPGMEEDL